MKHPYVVYGGGTSRNDLHSNDHCIDRPEFLKYREDKAKRVVVKTDADTDTVHELYYELIGNGNKKVMFVMGLLGTHTEWECNAPFLGEDCTVCVFDNRGVGLSDTPKGRWTTSNMANDCLQLLDVLAQQDGEEWKSRVHIIGSSMGGMISLEACLKEPSRFISLTLLSSHAGGMLLSMPPLSSMYTFLKTFSSRDLVDVLDNSLELKFPIEFVNERDSDGKPRRELLVKQILRRQRKYIEGIKEHKLEINPMALLKQSIAVATHYISWDRLYHLQRAMCGNVLVIVGEDDTLVKPINSIMLAQVLNGKLEVVPKAGHALQDQYPQRINKKLIDHIQTSEEKYKSSKPVATSFPPRTHPYLAYTLILTLTLLIRTKYRIHWTIPLIAIIGAAREFSGGFRIVQ